MIDRRLIQHFDWGLVAVTVGICAVGILTLYSAVSAGDPAAPERLLYIKQLFWYGAGALAIVICFLVDYRNIERWSGVIYAISLGMLVAVLLVGRVAGGSRRWLILGGFTFQPSEFAKIAVILLLARYYAKIVRPEGLGIRELGVPFLITIVPFLLIARQPDLGTGLIVFLIASTMTLFVKIERKTLVAMTAIVGAAAFIGSFFLKEYQRQRILVFLDPERDPLGAGYHILQSRIAIGSGMLTGKGMMKGTQNALSFLPEQHTDFIFSVLAEEWGFVGGATIHLLLLTLIIWGLNVAYNCKNPFGIIMAVGVTSMLFWQAAINLGMVMGLLPVVGVPLPLVSYGGSSVLTIMMCVGLLLNVSMRRFMA